MKFSANAGMEDIVSEQKPLIAKHNISAGDLYVPLHCYFPVLDSENCNILVFSLLLLLD